VNTRNDQLDFVEENPDGDAPLSFKLGFLRNLGCAALRSAWMETDSGVKPSMWDGLLPLITGMYASLHSSKAPKSHDTIAFPEVWSVQPIEQASIGTSEHAAAESDSDEDVEDGPMETTPNHATSSHSTTSHGHLAFADFLHFLELGCQGSAIHSYPAIVIVLSTIPETVCGQFLFLFANL
jgi:hypothetical protein